MGAPRGSAARPRAPCRPHPSRGLAWGGRRAARRMAGQSRTAPGDGAGWGGGEERGLRRNGERPPSPTQGAGGEAPPGAGPWASTEPGAARYRPQRRLPVPGEERVAPRSRREERRRRRPRGSRRSLSGRRRGRRATGARRPRAAGRGAPGPAGRTHVALRVDGLQQPVPDLLRGGGRSRCHCLGEAGRLRPGRAGGGAGPGRGGGSSLAGGGGLLGEPESHVRSPRSGGGGARSGARRNRGGATGPGPTAPLGAELNCGQEPAPRRAPWDTPDAVTHGAPLTSLRTHRRARRARARRAP